MAGFRFGDARSSPVTMRKLALQATCIVAILFGLVPLGSSSAALAHNPRRRQRICASPE